MVIEELHQKKVGVILQRDIVVRANDGERKESYYLVKCSHKKYFIGFSEDGAEGRNFVSEDMMLNMINDEALSMQEAMDIYVQTPQLSCWM